MRHIDNINIEIDKEKFRELLDLKDGPKGDQGETGAEGPIGPSGLRGENGKHGESGKNGKDGKDGEPGIDGEDGSPDTPIEIRDKLELLEGNYRLDAKAIKNLPMAPAVFAGRTKGFIESITDTASVDLIVTTGGALSATVLPAGVDHGALAGLGADDHTQYALLAGRATGQILVGGTAANDDLTLRATENATDGDIIFQSDPTTETMRITSVGRVGIGEPIPTSLLQVRGGGTAPTFRIDNDAGATGLFIQQISGTPTANYVDINDGVGAAIFDIDSSGDVGIGVASPTAVLHLKAGTATASTAPLKLTSGTFLTTLESGATEWDGLRPYITDTGIIRNTIAYDRTSYFSMNLDGVNKYINVPDAANLSFGNGTTDNPFSISCWVRFTAITSAQKGIVVKNNEYDLSINSGNQLVFILRDLSSGGSIRVTDSTTRGASDLGVWFNIICTYDGSETAAGIKMYINGASVGTTSTSGAYTAMENTTNSLQFGSFSASNFLNGRMDEVAIWNKELTTQEVSNIYNSKNPITLDSISGAIANVISWWRMGEEATFSTNWTIPDKVGTNTATSVNLVEADRSTTVSTPIKLHHDVGLVDNTILVGGTSTTGTLTLRTTKGVGTTGADMIFQVGSNGATEAMRIFNDGNISIGTTTNASLLNIIQNANNHGLIVEHSGILTGEVAMFVKPTSAITIQATNAAFKMVNTNTTANNFLRFDFADTKTGASTALIYCQFLNHTTKQGDLIFDITDSTSTRVAGLRIHAPVNASGSVGIGGITPSARLHIPAGTATASTGPLKFTSGTNLTTPENGVMEYNGINLFFTRAGAVRENVITESAVNVVSPTSPNRTITVNIDGTTYYISAKTTND